jgi:hypothetical protein
MNSCFCPSDELYSSSTREQGTAISFAPSSAGCAFTFTSTSNTFNGDENSSHAESDPYPNLSGFVIDGTDDVAGSCAVRSYDMTGFSMERMGLQNFSRVGDSCWLDEAVNVFTERSKVNAEMDNCMYGWYLFRHSGSVSGTAGYGRIYLWVNPDEGQTAVYDSGMDVSKASLDIVINASSGATGISLAHGASWEADSGIIHIEGASRGIVTDATSNYVVMAVTDIEKTTVPYRFNSSSHAEFLSCTLGTRYGCGINPVNNGVTWFLGAPSNCAFTNAIEEICVPAGFSTSVPLFGLDVGAVGGIFEVASDGSIYDRPGGGAGKLYHFTYQPGGGILVSTPSQLISGKSPRISSGFGTSPTIMANNGTVEIELKVGSVARRVVD